MNYFCFNINNDTKMHIYEQKAIKNDDLSEAAYSYM